MARQFRVYYFDLLGYGQSSKSDGDVSFGVQNQVLASLFDRWGLIDPYIIAHDFGGATALRAWAIDGLQYRGLMLMDAVALRPWGTTLVQHVREHEVVFAGMPDYMHEAVLKAYIQSAAFRPMLPADLQIHLDPWLGAQGQSALYRQIARMDMVYTDAIEPMLQKTPFPTLVVWGERDDWLPRTQGEELAGRLSPGRPMEILRGAGHLVQEDAPEAVVSAAIQFFAFINSAK